MAAQPMVALSQFHSIRQQRRIAGRKASRIDDNLLSSGDRGLLE
jgi:hypothetical protein